MFSSVGDFFTWILNWDSRPALPVPGQRSFRRLGTDSGVIATAPSLCPDELVRGTVLLPGPRNGGNCLTRRRSRPTSASIDSNVSSNELSSCHESGGDSNSSGIAALRCGLATWDRSPKRPLVQGMADICVRSNGSKRCG